MELLCTGDGELDMKEFIQVGKKLNFEDETLIIKAFRAADTTASGKLDTEEFEQAYEFL
jgi:Ca2+-binding EF-hand superfamily protein